LQDPPKITQIWNFSLKANHQATLARIARWRIFKPKILIWVGVYLGYNFGAKRMSLGHILGDAFTDSSGRPGLDPAFPFLF
jgi:hypothetical protein